MRIAFSTRSAGGLVVDAVIHSCVSRFSPYFAKSARALSCCMALRSSCRRVGDGGAGEMASGLAIGQLAVQLLMLMFVHDLRSRCDLHGGFLFGRCLLRRWCGRNTRDRSGALASLVPLEDTAHPLHIFPQTHTTIHIPDFGWPRLNRRRHD